MILLDILIKLAKEKKKYDDKLLRKVFNNKKDLLSLYNALKDGRSDKLVKLTDKKELERLYKEYDM